MHARTQNVHAHNINTFNNNDHNHDNNNDGSSKADTTTLTPAEVVVDDSLLSVVEIQQPNTKNDNNNDRAGTSSNPGQKRVTFRTKVCNFYTKTSFLLLVVLAILVAYGLLLRILLAVVHSTRSDK